MDIYMLAGIMTIYVPIVTIELSKFNLEGILMVRFKPRKENKMSWSCNVIMFSWNLFIYNITMKFSISFGVFIYVLLLQELLWNELHLVVAP